MIKLGNITAWLLPAGIAIGFILGSLAPQTAVPLGNLIDPIIFLMLGLLFFEVSFDPLRRTAHHLRFLSLAWIANFVVIPLLGWGIASLFFGQQSALYTGLLLYFLFPCTDWFLGFTRMSKGDVALGMILIPINLVSQLLLFPVFLALFIGSKAGTDLGGIAGTVAQWFLIPLLCGVVLRVILNRVLGSVRFEKVLAGAGAIIPWVIATLVLCIFARHTATLTAYPFAFVKILVAVFLFFMLTWMLGEVISRKFRLEHRQHALLSMTTAARNAPMILGLTMISMPDQPLIYAALIIGMLVEFPHLATLAKLLLRQAPPTSNDSNPFRTVTHN